MMGLKLIGIAGALVSFAVVGSHASPAEVSSKAPPGRCITNWLGNSFPGAMVLQYASPQWQRGVQAHPQGLAEQRSRADHEHRPAGRAG